ncbi:MAG: NUDIX domain-containing protein [Bacteroidales bacterium]|nr:NUDIX domain-containing protein [Bacteroidales bacterium]
MNNKMHFPVGLGDPDLFLPGVSIDCVVIGFDLNELHILLLKLKEHNYWMLPGGFIRLDEDMDQAATRILEERTGIRLPYLKQFHTFGDVNRREKRGLPEFNQIMSEDFTKMKAFIEQRFISSGYLSLVDMHSCVPAPDFLSDECTWIPLSGLPHLLYDHEEIVEKAVEQLKSRINYMPVGISLLPDKFTMKEFQTLYEQILGRNLDRGNFQKKMLKLGFLDRREKQLTGGAHKAPYLYSFNKKRYDELVEKGIGYIS